MAAMMSQVADPMRAYRGRRDAERRNVLSKYTILGFISSGTYGRVYKAQARDLQGGLYAIKKFKPDKEGEVVTYTGISQSACREIALTRECKHENVVALREVMLEDKSIYMVFEYAEHDFLQIIHHHSQTLRSSITVPVLKTLLYQLLNGVLYLHASHIMHRDLKPANILITSSGIVKIGDLGLARLCHNPLLPLVSGDKVVVTIWYRAPELLMGAKHYTKAIDCWAVGCIFAELLSLRPIFKGEEAKLDAKKNVPFQRDQVIKIFEVLGTPDAVADRWPGLPKMPEYANMLRLDRYNYVLPAWVNQRLHAPAGFDLIAKLFDYNPTTRITAQEALAHKWFTQDPKPTHNAFLTTPPHQPYPLRRVTNDEAPTMVASRPASSGSFAFRGLPANPGAGSGGRKKARLE
ncbi:hypothetical protein BOTBODRAFT_44117 [Botryobasidium botryosum FD-172 SS1]|uniref:Cyclin-dependent kinase 8 n=1 Tax=Botryobasidium botryosum (strain FD-172 SS1) TaxID=930990 RepID=A0A067MUE4_BOTB1|nr:hypothetical protein BOTBODRAFT_44117 [Botryobasidium botryosum FD-172 SS1]